MADIKTNQGKLYKALHGVGFKDLGSEEQFAAKLQDAGSRQKLYNAMQKQGFKDLGDYESFEKRIYDGASGDNGSNGRQLNAEQQQVQAAGQKQAQAAQGSYKPSWQEEMAFGSTIGSAMRAGQGAAESYDRTARNMEEYRKQKPLGGGVAKTAPKWNAETGEMEQEYLTSAGTEHKSRYDAENLQRRINDTNWREFHPLEAAERENAEDLKDIREEAEHNTERRIEAEGRGKREGEGFWDFFKRSVKENLGSSLVSGITPMGMNVDRDQVEDAMVRSGAYGAERRAIANERDAIVARKRLAEETRELLADIRKDQQMKWGIVRAGEKVLETALNPHTWDFGEADLSTQLAVADAVVKADSGLGMSDNERKLLDTWTKNAAINSQFADELSGWTKAGMVTGESLPFMLEMAINPASGLGEAATSQLVKYSLKKYGAKWVKDHAKSMLAKKIATRLAGDVVGAGLMSSTTGIARVAADTERRMTGDVDIMLDDNGDVIYKGVKDAESPGAAIFKAMSATSIENWSEMAGNYLGFVNSFFGKALGKSVIGKAGRKMLAETGSIEGVSLNKAQRFIYELAAGKGIGAFSEGLAQFAKRTQWHGVIGEYLEEEIGNIANAAIVGDMTFDTAEGTGVFNLQQNIDTFCGVALMGGFMSALNTAGYAAHRYNYDVDRVSDANAKLFGDDLWSRIRTTIDSSIGDPRALNDVLTDLIRGDGGMFDADGKKAIMRYTQAALEKEGGEMANYQPRMASSSRDEVSTEDGKQYVVTSFDKNGDEIEQRSFKNEDEAVAYEGELKMQQQKRDYDDYLSMTNKLSYGEAADVVDEFLGRMGLDESNGTDRMADVLAAVNDPKSELGKQFLQFKTEKIMEKAQASRDAIASFEEANGWSPGTVKWLSEQDPMQLDEESLEMADQARTFLEGLAYPADEVHVEHEQQVGTDAAQAVVELVISNEEPIDPQNNAGEQIVAQYNDAKNALNELFDRNEDLAQEYRRLTELGLSPQEVVSSLDSFRQEDVQTVIDYYNAEARQVSFLEEASRQIDSVALRNRERRTFKGTINGEENGETVIAITDGANSYTLVSGNVTADSGGRITGSDSGLIIGLDDDGNFVNLGDKNMSIVPGGMTLDEWEELERERLQEDVTSVIDPNGVMQEEETQGQGDRESENDESVQQPLTEEQANNLLAQMEEQAVEDPKIGLTQEAWAQSFGINNSMQTPIGNVKMGEHQYQKLVEKNRTSEFGMVVQTLQDPDVILIEPSQATEGQETERPYSLVFVKTFVRDGKKIKYYASVTVQRDNMEVSVSSHFMNANRVKDRLMTLERIYTKQALIPNSSDWHLAEQQNAVPDLLPTQGNNASSVGKGTENVGDVQENAQKIAEITDKDGVKRYENGVDIDAAIADIEDDGLDVNETIDLAISEAQQALEKIKTPKTRAEQVKNAKKRAELQNTIEYYTRMRKRVDEINRLSGVNGEENVNVGAVEPQIEEKAVTSRTTPNVEEKKQARIQALKEELGELFDDDFTKANDAHELVSMWIGRNRNLAWDDVDGRRGLQKELGWTRRIGGDTKYIETILAKKGEGVGVDEFVHTVWESPENEVDGEKRFDTAEIKDALLDLLASAQSKSDVVDYAVNTREAQARKVLEEIAQREQEEREAFNEADGLSGEVAPVDIDWEDMPFLPEMTDEEAQADDFAKWFDEEGNYTYKSDENGQEHSESDGMVYEPTARGTDEGTAEGKRSDIQAQPEVPAAREENQREGRPNESTETETGVGSQSDNTVDVGQQQTEGTPEVSDDYLKPRNEEEQQIIADVDAQLNNDIAEATEAVREARRELGKARVRESDRATDMFANDDALNEPGQLFDNSEMPVDQSADGVVRRTQEEAGALAEAERRLESLQSEQERNARVRGALDNYRRQTSIEFGENGISDVEVMESTQTYKMSDGQEIRYEHDGELQELPGGDFSLVERAFRENGYFGFSGGRIESSDDVAYIFRNLEDAAIEHAFIVLVKDGEPRIIHVGMGSFAATPVNMGAVRAAYDAFGADEIYFVHNHPSGLLKESRQDRNVLEALVGMFEGENVDVQPGIIMNQKSGKYGVFGDDWNEQPNRIEDRPSESNSEERELRVLEFDKQVFSRDYDITKLEKISSSDNIAAFLTSHRLGEREKLSVLILSQANEIIGNVALPYNGLQGDLKEISKTIASVALRYGGVRVVPYGNFELDGARLRALNKHVERASGKSISILDAVSVENGLRYSSAYDYGVMEPSDNPLEAIERNAEAFRREQGEKKAENNGIDSGYSESDGSNGSDGVNGRSEHKESIRKHVEKLLKKLGTRDRTTVITSINGVRNKERREHIERAHREGRKVYGWFENGRIFLYMPDIDSAYKAEQTIWHETVAHVGLRELLGAENYGKLLNRLWMEHKDKEMGKWVTERMQTNGWSLHKAIDEWLAREAEKVVAERQERRTLWQKLAGWIGDVLREIGYRTSPTVTDVRYLFWLSENQLREGEPMSEIKRAAFLHRLERENDAYGMNGENGVSEDSGYSEDLDNPLSISAKEVYDDRLNRVETVFTEAYQDAMISLKTAQNAIAGDMAIPDSQNAYMAENLMHGKNKNEQDLFNSLLRDPLIETVNNIMGVTGMNWGDVDRYVYTKSGLERNREFFVRDWLERERAKEDADIDALSDLEKGWNDTKGRLYGDLQTGRISFAEYLEGIDSFIRSSMGGDYNPSEHDYSGFMAMFGNEDGVYNEADIVADLMNTEDQMEQDRVDRLWQQINAATQYGLERYREAGMRSDEQIDKIEGMFHWYVPMRGFKEDKGEDMYQYFSSRGNAKSYVGGLLKHAKGRGSEANYPISTIFAMTYKAISDCNQNLVNQKLYRLCQANENDLIVLSDSWAVLNETTGEWEEAYPTLTDDMDEEEIRQATLAFEQEMRDLAKDGKAQKITGKAQFDYVPMDKKKRSEHVVEVRINGQLKRMTVVGNPRMAQALNGQLRFEKGKNVFSKWNAAIKNKMASLFTSYSPTFALRNMFRDWTHFRTMLSVREGERYARAANKYYRQSLFKMVGLFKKYREGTLDMSNDMERDFKDFMDNGGITGFVQMQKVDDIQKEMEKLYKQQKQGKAIKLNNKIWDYTLGAIEAINEGIENNARFATYRASRHAGQRTRARSAYDAKEITVNFNRKGAGSKTAGFKSQSKRVEDAAKAFGVTSQVLGEGRIFFNATVQAIATTFKNFQNADGSLNKSYIAKWAGRYAAPPFLFGLALPMINKALVAALGADGDDDPYANLAEWTRRKNICIYIGNDNFITIPIGQELAAFLSLGDMVAGMTYAPELKPVDKSFDEEIVGIMDTFSPVDISTKITRGGVMEDPISEVTGRTFSVLAPLVAVEQNLSWTGRPIYREDRFQNDQYTPEYQMVYSGTNPVLANASKLLHELGGGDDITRGNIEVNPAIVQYLWEQYTGGPGKVFSNTISIGKDAKDLLTGNDTEFNIRKVEGLKAFVQQGDDRTQYYRTQAKYRKYKEDAEKLYHDVKGYENGAMENPMYLMKLEEITKGDDFVRMQIIREADKQLSEINKAANKVEGKERKELRRLYNEQVRAVVEMLDEVGKE